MVVNLFGYLWTFCFIQIGEQFSYTGPLCRYHYHYTATTWARAREICNRTNRTLLMINSDDEVYNITTTVIQLVKDVAAGQTSFITDISSVLWIGLHQETNPVRLLWDNCAQFAVHDNAWNPGSSEGCVVLNITDGTYELHSCDDTRAFICEDLSEDDGECFDEIIGAASEIPSDLGHDGSTDTEYLDFTCQKYCGEASNCAAFQRESNTCFRHYYGNSQLRRDREPIQIFVKNLFIQTDTSLATSPIISDYYCPEQSTVSSLYSTTGREVSSSVQPTTSSVQATTSSVQATASSVQATTSSAQATTSSAGVSDTTPIMTSSAVVTGSTSSSCFCPCTLSLASTTITTAELQAKIEQMQTELTVNRKETSSYKRKLTSAPDDRVSAQSIGYVGVVILSVVTGLLVCIDIPTITKDSLAFFKRCRRFCCKR